MGVAKWCLQNLNLLELFENRPRSYKKQHYLPDYIKDKV